MLREQYHHDMRNLEARTLDLGRTVASAVYEAVDALVRGDTARADSIVARDQDVNRERMEIQARVLTVIATQQPVASDIRLLASILEAVAEIERIGDYAKGIATIVLKVRGETLPPAVLYRLLEMAELARAMMRSSLDAFQERDASSAARIIADDEAVDALFKEVFSEVVGSGGDRQALEVSNYLLWVAHNLERTADRVTNICEGAIYVVSGQLVEGKTSTAVDEFLSSLAAGRVGEDGRPGEGQDP